MMDRIDRRTFLATGIKTGAALAAIGVVADGAVDVAAPATASAAGKSARPQDPPGPPTNLTTTGVAGPVGVDPDDVQFAWHVADGRRGAVQSGYRVEVTGPDGSSSTVWDSGEVASGQQAFVGYGGPPLSGDARYRWTVRTADKAGRWGAPATAATFTTGLRTGDWTALWLRARACRPGRGGVQLPPHHPGAARRHHHPGHGLRGRRPQVPAVGERCPARHRPELLLPRRAVLPGDRRHRRRSSPGTTNAVGILHHWYGPGQGRPASAPGLLVQVVVHYADGRAGHPPIGRHVADHDRREWLPAPQRNNDVGDFVEWIDGRPHPDGLVRGRLRRRHLVAGRRERPGGHGAVHPSLRPADPDQRTPGRPGVRPDPAHRLGGGRLRQGLRRAAHGVVPPRVDGQTVPLHVGYTLDPDGAVSTTHDTQDTDLSFSYTQRSGAQTFEPYWYLGFRYLQIDDPGETLGGDQVAPHGPPRHHAGGGRGHLLVVRADARRRVGPVRPFGSLHLPGAVHRHARPGRRASSCGTRPTSPRR